MKVLIIVPAYNEAENIEKVAAYLDRCCPAYDYVVVNDGSADRTAQICREKNIPLIDLPVNLGLAGAFQTGMRYAYLHGYDAAAQFDGDGQHDARYLEKMVQVMESEHPDIVIGSRFVTERKPRSLRMFGSNLIASAIRLTTGKKLSDPTSGMRLFNQSVMKDFALNLNFGPEPDTVSYLIKNGATVKEVQVVMHERTAGVSYLNLSRSVRYMANMIVSILLIQGFRKKAKRGKSA